jgi:hypothetical protein
MGNAILGALRYLLAGLGEFVAQTTNPWDDFAVDVMNAAVESQVIQDWLAGLLETPAGAESLSSPPEAVVAEFESRGIPWAKVMQYLPQIIALLRVFLGK